MQYSQEDSVFYYSQEPSNNKRRYLAIALGMLAVFGAVCYFNQPSAVS